MRAQARELLCNFFSACSRWCWTRFQHTGSSFADVAVYTVGRREGQQNEGGRTVQPSLSTGAGRGSGADLPLAALEPFRVRSFRWREKALPLLVLWPRLQSRTMRAHRNLDFYGPKSGHPYPSVRTGCCGRAIVPEKVGLFLVRFGTLRSKSGQKSVSRLVA